MDKHEWYLDQWLEPCVVNLLKLIRIDLSLQYLLSCVSCFSFGSIFLEGTFIFGI